MDRRLFLHTLASIAAAGAAAESQAGSIRRRLSLPGNPFALGVASGDPSPDGFVLWTRLAPDPLMGGGMPPVGVEVDWQVAEDEGMRRVVRQGTVIARSEWAHSAHVEVEGLQPDRWYWYRFRAAGETSPVGRTHTLPLPHAAPERLRFAFASCQHWESGYFTAYRHVVGDAPDLVFHLGDYIYEGAGRPGQVRRHVGPVLTQVEHYRNRHAQYRTDPDLQAAHAACPWIMTWDDHEFANNYANLVSERASDSPGEYRMRRAHAYQAYWEHMPLRRASVPRGPDMRLYRRFGYGDLAELLVLDTRQYRTDQPNGDGQKPPSAASESPDGTLLGAAQRRWLFDRLDRSNALWNVLAQQVMMAAVDRIIGAEKAYSMDQWPGYEYERRRVLRFLRDRYVSNPVVLTGDIHSNWANELTTDFDGASGGRTVAAEFVGTSISSGGDGVRGTPLLERLQRDNPFVKYQNGQRGYVRMELTRGCCRADYRVLDYVTRPGSPVRTGASFLLEPASSRLHRI